EIHSRSEGSTPYEVGLKYPLELIWPVAQVASFRRPPETLVSGFLENLKKRLQHEDSAVRYWAALGLLRFSKDGVEAAKDDLHRSLADASAHVRIVAAEALGRYGNEEDLKKSLDVLKELVSPKKNGVFVSMAALNALGELGEKARP